MSTEKLTEREANTYSPLTLAFLGDSVYDTLVREHLLRQANMPVAKIVSRFHAPAVSRSRYMAWSWVKLFSRRLVNRALSAARATPDKRRQSTRTRLNTAEPRLWSAFLATFTLQVRTGV